MILTLSELARWVDGDIVRGGLDLSITGMDSLDLAGPGDVSFLGNEKYHSQFLLTQAAAVIVPRGGSVTQLGKVSDWRGMAMFHCHIVEHEDIGMLGVWQID